MSEELSIDFQSSLELLEDTVLHKPLAKGQYFQVVIKSLESEDEFSNSVLNRLLAICVEALEGEVKPGLHHVLRIIGLILNKIDVEDLTTLPHLLPSILRVFNLMKSAAKIPKMELTQGMCFDILLQYPNYILRKVATLHTSEIKDIICLYCTSDKKASRSLKEKILWPMLLKFLTVTLPEEKSKLVKLLMPLWFSKVIPAAVASSDAVPIPLDILECLTDELVNEDYSEIPEWLQILECISNSQKYPAIMRMRLNTGSKIWHRLWIVFIRLLKNQITKTNYSSASPINSMLPVVELAFKMDEANRCRAFQCWEVLIDNFSAETNEGYAVKQLKLLIVPLRANNTKVEETALAKLKTWWHLIFRFQNRLEKFVDMVIISFLHFCFGKHLKNKPNLVHGLFSPSTKKQSVQAFIELAGHFCCNGCVNMPKLNRRIISKTVLVDHWNDWVFSLKSAIKIGSEDIGLTTEQLECLWKSFVMIVSELPDNNIRKDLFNELLSVLEDLAKNSEPNQNLADIVVSLITSMFKEKNIQVLFKSKDENSPFFTIISLLLDPSLNIFYRGSETNYIVMKLMPLTNYVIEEISLISRLLLFDEHQNISYLLTALAESACQLKSYKTGDLTDLMLWPLKAANSFADVEYSTQVWVRLINNLYPKLKMLTREKLRNALNQDSIHSNTHLKLNLSLAILNYELAKDPFATSTKMVETLLMMTNKIEDQKHIKDNLKMLTDTMVSLLKIIENIDSFDKSGFAENTLYIIRNLIKFMQPILEEKSEIKNEYEDLYENLLEKLNFVVLKHGSSPLTKIIIDELLNFTTLLQTQPKVHNCVLNIMKTYLSSNKDVTLLVHNFKKIASFLGSEELFLDSNMQEDLNKDKFAAPETAVVKKVKKKETSIVNTVIENGEEFVVVKSNWKFNPRKLTENQKEKFQRKREIPALYQDLSQSQDEFKLSTWKTDSQDSSSTNSKSTTTSVSGNTGDVNSVLLKSMPSSDVVPKIIENIFSEKKDVDGNEQDKLFTKITKELTTNLKNKSKDPKSPRMALKDRVFRNVRNLIEKSNIQNDGNETKKLSESVIQVNDLLKTPPPKSVDNSHLVNSAPPTIVIDRPSRMKRMPKKFDDVQMFASKRIRRSSCFYDSHPDSQDNTKEANSQMEKNDVVINSDKCQTANEKPSSKTVTNDEKTEDDEIVSENKINAPMYSKTETNNTDREHATVLAVTRVVDNNFCHTKNIENAVAPKNVETADEVPNEQDVADEVLKSTNVMSVDRDLTIECTPWENTSIVSKSLIKENNTPLTETPAVKADEKIISLPSDIPDKFDQGEDKALPVGNKIVKTSKQAKKQEILKQRSSRKNGVKKSRIQNELAIDTVEGHPFLKIQTEKRVTRKNFNNSLNNSRRKGLSEKLNKSKIDTETPLKTQPSCSKKKGKEKSPSVIDDNVSVIVGETQDTLSRVSEDLPFSEDIIESSQDSTFTTISVNTTKGNLKKLSVLVEKVPLFPSVSPLSNKKRQINNEDSIERTMEVDNKDDSVLPQNKTAITDNTDMDLTENMDTQPVDSNVIEDKDNSSDVIIINDDEEPIVIGSETQEIAEADTQTIDSSVFSDPTYQSKSIPNKITDDSKIEIQMDNISGVNTEDEVTTTINASIDISRDEVTTTSSAPLNLSNQTDDANTASSPFKNVEQRKQDFLDNTLEISPIKTMSPIREKKSPSPETSSDYVVIKLSSPVQSNGEPFEKCDSPEIFTEDKISPDKRDLSPSREETVVQNTSPSSSLSLKKNRPQVRSGGRAAQMLGLCVPDRLQTIMNTERSEPEEPKKNSPSSTPARRNLRILYNSVGGENSENSEENEDSDSFLKLKRTLPTNDCSPSGPILKRKLAEITDDATVSPASKRKRVSFHDPPVSTTISVQKYIEPLGVRSPQNSAIKRLERQNLRSQAILKSPKRLENVFKLDTVLTKAVESFTDIEQTSTDLTQSMSLNETPAVEIIKASDLNDVDPICPNLIDCTDSIDCIAAELSSGTMKTMFLLEIEGKLATVGDLARMTELEVNRLCIKAPKVKVARQVLSDYAFNKIVQQEDPIVNTVEMVEKENSPEVEIVNNVDIEIVDEMDIEIVDKVDIEVVDKVDIEIQTTATESNDVEIQTTATESNDVEIQTTATESNDVEIQTIAVNLAESFMQTDEKETFNAGAQTNESGARSTKEIITTCLAERPDFVEKLCKNLENSSRERIAEQLPFDLMSNVFMKNVTSANSFELITRILQKLNKSETSEEQNGNDLSSLQNYLCTRFENQYLILFCSQLLAKIHSRQS